MRCSRKSIRSSASCLAALLLLAVPLRGAGSEIQPGTFEERVRAAIEAAVRARVGRTARVSVGDVSSVRVADEQPRALLATPDPSARVGVPTRFVLADGRPGRTLVRVGEVTVVVAVSDDVVRTRRAIARGVRLEGADVTFVPADLDGRALAALPSLEDAVGARTTRDLGAGAVVTRADIQPQPIIRSGDVVRAHIRVGGVEVATQVVAAGNGFRNGSIRVVNPDSRHAMRARVISRSEVEVVDVR